MMSPKPAQAQASRWGWSPDATMSPTKHADRNHTTSHVVLGSSTISVRNSFSCFWRYLLSEKNRER